MPEYMDRLPRGSANGVSRITALLPCWFSPSAAAATDRQTRTLPLAPGRASAIEDSRSVHVTIEGSDRADVEMVFERHAPTTEGLVRIPVVIDESSPRE